MNSFIAAMTANGGMSLSNNFVVKFDNPPVPIPGVSSTTNIFEMLCEEAQLPNSSAATGTLKGRYLGEGQVNYPHTRVFSEFQLGFQCDANMSPLKFLQDWYGFIYNERPVSYEDEMSLEKQQGEGAPAANRTHRLQYPASYCTTIFITKTEMGGNGSTERAPITYRLERAWPFAIDAVPLQFGTSQITKVTAQFYYTKHTILSNDISNSAKYRKIES